MSAPRQALVFKADFNTSTYEIDDSDRLVSALYAHDTAYPIEEAKEIDTSSPNKIEVSAREWELHEEGYRVPIYRPKRVKKLTARQCWYLEKHFIKPRLVTAPNAYMAINEVLDGSGSEDWREARLSSELNQLWKLYHRGEIADEDELKGADHYLLQAAALKVFYTIHHPSLADEGRKNPPAEIITENTSKILFNSQLPVDLSSKILSYIAPVDLYFILCLVNHKIREAAFLELRQYINADIQQNRNVFYVVGAPVRFTDEHIFWPYPSSRKQISNSEFKLVTGHEKEKMFKSRYAALKYAEKFRRDGDLSNGFQPAVFKVVYRGLSSDFDNNKQEVFFTFNQGVSANHLYAAEQSFLAEFMEVPKDKIIAAEASLPILNHNFTYHVYQTKFTTLFDSDRYSDMHTSSFYVHWYAAQEKQRNWYTFYVVLAAIVLTPLSLLVLIPLWIRAKNNEPIQKLVMSEEEYKQIKLMENKLDKTAVKTEEKENRNESIKDEKMSEVKKTPASKELILSNHSRTILYCDKYQKERLLFFKQCCKENTVTLTASQKQFLEGNEKESNNIIKSLMVKALR